MSDEETLRVYAQKARDYEALARPDEYPTLTTFIAALPKGGDVLDLGCGPGLEAARMAQVGLRVEAMDASPEMVALAAARPGVAAQQGSFDDLCAERRYDGVWASFSLLHAPRAEMPRHLAAIARALRPDGVLSLTLKEGQGEARDRLGRFYSYYTEPELRRLLADVGLRVDAVARGSGTGLDGTSSPWLSVLAHG
ncbi:class I SAM-dependent DNA methyltransferase [Alloyangia pacifica]|uniref:class I SAM-dependent DNA methyltransferase n=1 Tax=Alloyangia pacifica TaxID=311180 RepID=UPI001CD2264E|nr:class I SAM-dependent methyltransferase [Alloyangia pacifica]MCA0997466.1 methyltransferase domain-containing protein [Alloyangia pacifica]